MYRSKDDVVLYEIIKPRTVPTLWRGYQLAYYFDLKIWHVHGQQGGLHVQFMALLVKDGDESGPTRKKDEYVPAAKEGSRK